MKLAIHSTINFNARTKNGYPIEVQKAIVAEHCDENDRVILLGYDELSSNSTDLINRLDGPIIKIKDQLVSRSGANSVGQVRATACTCYPQVIFL